MQYTTITKCYQCKCLRILILMPILKTKFHCAQNCSSCLMHSYERGILSDLLCLTGLDITGPDAQSSQQDLSMDTEDMQLQAVESDESL